jgi:hypothetical protein
VRAEETGRALQQPDPLRRRHPGGGRGTDGGELPDLWQQTWLELEALEEVPKAEAWTNAPGRVSTRNATVIPTRNQVGTFIFRNGIMGMLARSRGAIWPIRRSKRSIVPSQPIRQTRPRSPLRNRCNKDQ